MSYSLGVVLIVYGSLQLALLQWAADIKRRFKPWFRDDENKRNDFGLRMFLFVSTFAASVAAIEIGQWLASLQVLPLLWRIVIYVAVACFNAWRLMRIRATHLA
jgi:hypothetical protein